MIDTKSQTSIKSFINKINISIESLKKRIQFFLKHLQYNLKARQAHLTIYYIYNRYTTSFRSRDQLNTRLDHTCLNYLITLRKTFM